MTDTLDYLPNHPARSWAALATAPASSVILAIADRWRFYLWAFVAVCYAAAFNGQWRMQPDAALYLSVGKNLATGHGFTYLGQHEGHAYPGWPVLISIVFRLFGTSSLVPVNLLMLAIAGLSLACVYRLFLIHRDRPTAVVMSVGVGLTKAFFCYAFELWSDLPFTLGVLAFLAGYEAIVPLKTSLVTDRARWYDWALAVGGLVLALSMRPTGWPFLLAVGLGLAVDAVRRRVRWKTLGAIAAGASVLAGAAFLVLHRSSHADFGRVYLDYVHGELSGSESGLLRHNVGQNIQSLFSWAASDVLFQTRFGPVCNSVLSMVVLALGLGLFRHRAMWGFWFCLLLGTILISQETLDRYFLPVLPLLVFAWWDELVRLGKRFNRPAGDLIFLFLLAFGSIVNLTKCCGIVMQQHTRPFLTHYDNGQYDAVPAMADYIRHNVPPNAVVVARAPYGRVISFLSGRTVVSAVDVTVPEAWSRPVYILEPTDSPAQGLIEAAHFKEDAPVFVSAPGPAHDTKAVTLSLRPAHR